MAHSDIGAPPAAVTGRVPASALVVGAIASVQFGGALAVHLFAAVGPGGATLLRLASATIVLVAIWRPRLGRHARRELLLAALFGLVLAGMNLSFYSAIHRIPLGVAVSLEFVGPLAVAIGGSRRRLDLLWVGLAAAGILTLTHSGGHGVDGLGILLALTAGCLWGGYILISARVGRAFAGGSGLTLAMCVSTVVALPVGVVAGGSHLLEPRSLALGAAIRRRASSSNE